jgi:acyl carrier protein
MSAAELGDVESAIKRLLITELQADAALIENADEDTPLLGRGIGLDSIEALRLALGLEKEFDLQIPDSDLTVELFASVRSLAEYVQRKILERGVQ